MAAPSSEARQRATRRRPEQRHPSIRHLTEEQITLRKGELVGLTWTTGSLRAACRAIRPPLSYFIACAWVRSDQEFRNRLQQARGEGRETVWDPVRQQLIGRAQRLRDDVDLDAARLLHRDLFPERYKETSGAGPFVAGDLILVVQQIRAMTPAERADFLARHEPKNLPAAPTNGTAERPGDV